MITEDYVSFETAKLLREKGFDIHGYASIKVFGGNTYEVNGEWINVKEDTIIPTLQMAMKWLRKEHNLHIMVDCIGAENYIPTIQFTRNSKDIEIKSEISKIGGNGFDSHEEACEAAIKYCLENLI